MCIDGPGEEGPLADGLVEWSRDQDVETFHPDNKKVFVLILFLPVLERSRDVYAHIQPHLPDAPYRTLERLSSIPRSVPPRLSSQFLGVNKRTTGMSWAH